MGQRHGQVFALVPAARSEITPSISEHINIWGNERQPPRTCPSLQYHQRAVPLSLSAAPPPSCIFPTAHVLPPQEKSTPFSASWGAGCLHGPHCEPEENREGSRAGDGEGRPTLPKRSADLGCHLALFPLSPVFMAAQP